MFLWFLQSYIDLLIGDMNYEENIVDDNYEGFNLFRKTNLKA